MTEYTQTSLQHVSLDAQGIIDYLANHLPGYPYDPDIDSEFVQELLDDFSHLDILEELKTLRWYAHNKPLEAAANPRLALRRWLKKKHW